MLSFDKIPIPVISYQLSVISSLRKLPTPHTLHPTPYPHEKLFQQPLAIFSPILRFLGLYRNDN
ncbi:hypothetical protein ED562_20270 [Microcystis aeruginosa FACHB-524]|nr:hypothetical protein ED562_20270 [Microcystis aeruginosa FACHB-524]